MDLVKVLGHSGEEGNEGADRLANLGATMPTVPDRDWADLIEQTRARVNMVRPAQGVAITQDTARGDVPVARAPLTNGNIGRQAQVDVPSIPAVENVIKDVNPPEPAAADLRVVVPRRTKPVSAAKPPVSVAAAKAPAIIADPQGIVYGDPNIKISPEEWEVRITVTSLDGTACADFALRRSALRGLHPVGRRVRGGGRTARRVRLTLCSIYGLLIPVGMDLNWSCASFILYLALV